MSATKTPPITSSAVEPTIQNRIILTMGGKGGVGKTSVTLTIAEWLRSHEVPFTLLDLDTENKARGSLKHYYREARKVNIHTPAGLDTFIDAFDDGHLSGPLEEKPEADTRDARGAIPRLPARGLPSQTE